MSTAVSHRLSTELQTIESQHGVKSRWRISDPEYKQAEKAQASLVRSSLFEAIKDCSVKRKFLLHIKAKYAGEGLMHGYVVNLALSCIICRWPKNSQETINANFQGNNKT